MDLQNKFKNQQYYNLLSNDDDLYCLTEIQIGNKITDMVIVNHNLTNIIAIEFKINKWKNALIQASNYQLWAKKSYVVLPKNHVEIAIQNKDIFQKMGIGLISVENECNIELYARESPWITQKYLSLAKDVIKSKLSEVSESERAK